MVLLKEFPAPIKGVKIYHLGCDWPGCTDYSTVYGVEPEYAANFLKNETGWGLPDSDGIYCAWHLKMATALIMEGGEPAGPKGTELRQRPFLSLCPYEEESEFPDDHRFGPEKHERTPTGEIFIMRCVCGARWKEVYLHE